MFLKNNLRFRSLRFFTNSSFSQSKQEFNSQSKIFETISQLQNGKPIEESNFINLIKQILNFKHHSKNNKFEYLNNSLFNDVINIRHIPITENCLRKILLLNPSLENCINLLQIFQLKNPNSIIPKSISMILIRKLLWEGDVNNSLKIIKLTTGSNQYLSFKKKQQNKNIIKYITSIGGIIGGIDLSFKMMSIEPMMNVYAMILTYILNVSFFGTLAFNGLISQTSNYIQFIKGTSLSYKNLHSDELNMISKIAEIDILINDNNNNDGSSNYSKFIEKLHNYGFNNYEMIEQESDILMQEYWLSGGDNFKWDEPDQDPAELLWKERLKFVKSITSTNFLENNSTKWTKNLIEIGKIEDENINGSIIA